MAHKAAEATKPLAVCRMVCLFTTQLMTVLLLGVRGTGVRASFAHGRTWQRDG